MKKIIVAVVFLALSACTTNRTLYVNEKGQTVYQADCGRWRRNNMGDCLIAAGKQCPNGFDIIMAQDQISGIINNGQTNGNISPNPYTAQTSFQADNWNDSTLRYNRYLIYTCK